MTTLLNFDEDLFTIEPAEWLINNVLPAEGITLLTGDISSGKSFLALDIAASVASGSDWHGNKVKQAGVVYLPSDGFQRLPRRMAAWEQAHGDIGAFYATKDQVLPEAYADLDLPPDTMLVVLDQLFAATPEVVAAIAALRKRYNCAVLIVHADVAWDKECIAAVETFSAMSAARIRVSDDNGMMDLVLEPRETAPHKLRLQRVVVDIGEDTTSCILKRPT